MRDLLLPSSETASEDVDRHGANCSLLRLLNRLCTCSPQTYGSAGGWCSQLLCREGMSCRRKRYFPWVWCLRTVAAVGLCLKRECLLTLFLRAWIFKVPHSTQDGFKIFLLLLLLFVYSMCYWILWRPTLNQELTGCCRMPQWACGLSRQNKEGGSVRAATGMWPSLAPTPVIKWEQGHVAPPSREKQKLWALARKASPVFVCPRLAAVFCEIRIFVIIIIS